ncbi:MAG: hypothetical protein EPN49_09535 [Rhodanobacter sp.]|nr:MAG: hypothetical protein EPN49_09535 [Rhodanobacter sp.]
MTDATRYSLDDLLAIMARLRDPERGCPWDVQQDFASIAPYTIAEAYEVADAIDRGEPHDASALAGISSGLPEWKRALKLQQRAAGTGFDWPDPQPVLAKLAEEIDEVRAEFADGADPVRLEDEIGDVLFVMVNLARHAGVDFSRALRRANAKFERRFRRMEQLAAADGGAFGERTLAEQEQLWQRAKSLEPKA